MGNVTVVLFSEMHILGDAAFPRTPIDHPNGEREQTLRGMCVQGVNIAQGCSPLFDAKMCVDAGVPCCPRQILVFPVRNMSLRSGVPIFLGKSKVNDEKLNKQKGYSVNNKWQDHI